MSYFANNMPPARMVAHLETPGSSLERIGGRCLVVLGRPEGLLV